MTSASKNITGSDTTPMDFSKPILQILRPKSATYAVLFSFFALIFMILTALLSSTTIANIPITISFSRSSPFPPPPDNTPLTTTNSLSFPSPLPYNTPVTIANSLSSPSRTSSPPPDTAVANLIKNESSSTSIRNVTLPEKYSSSVHEEEEKEEGRGRPNCDIFEGSWVVDDDGSRRPSYEPGECPFVEEHFNCFGNGRLDLNYTLLRWQPSGCSLPRMDGLKMLEMLRGRRMVFVGDSLNRNMYESLVCMLWRSVPNKNRVIDLSGKFKKAAGFSALFADYNSTIDYFLAPFLVREWTTISEQNRTPKYTLRLDKISKESALYKNADIMIFNTAHWWTHEKTSLGKDFYQEGEYVHSQLSPLEAYRRGLKTWAKWVDHHVDSRRTRVFFRGYSASHFSGGEWNTGGKCHGHKQPLTLTNSTQIGRLNQMMNILEGVLEGMSTPVQYLDITRMSDYRKDAHPSIFRRPAEKRRNEMIQDCNHWCLPGVPDAWNELLYTMLISNTST